MNTAHKSYAINISQNLQSRKYNLQISNIRLINSNENNFIFLLTLKIVCAFQHENFLFKFACKTSKIFNLLALNKLMNQEKYKNFREKLSFSS